MNERQGRWWAPYLVRVTTVQVAIHGQSQTVRAHTFHLPPDPQFRSSWRADAVITIDDVAVNALAPTEAEALDDLCKKVVTTWEARVAKQRNLTPELRNLTASHPEDVHLNEPWLSIHWDRERRYIHADFKGFANSAEFRASTMKIIDAIRARGANALVSDNRGLEGVSESDQQWLRDTWMPEAVQAGVRRIAVVLAHHGTGKVASEDIISSFGKTEFTTRTFESLPAAVEWAARGEQPDDPTPED